MGTSSTCGICYAAQLFAIGFVLVVGAFIILAMAPEHPHVHIKHALVYCVEGHEAYADANHNWVYHTTLDGERVPCATIEGAR